MTESAKKALEVLVGIAEDDSVEADTRVRAAASILNMEQFEQVQQPVRI